MRGGPLAPLLAAQVVSKLGTQMSGLALPWFVLVTTGSPTQMGLVLAAEVLGTAALGLPSGALVARIGARRTMLLSDLARAPLVASIPALHMLDLVSLPLLVGVAFAIGAFTAPYFASQRLVLPELLPADDVRLLARANSLVEGAGRVTTVAGPALAGLLIAWLGAPNVLWLDAASYLASFGLLVQLPARSRVRAENECIPGLLAGVRVLVGDRHLSGSAATILLFGAVFPVLFASLPVYALTRHAGDARVAGSLFAAWGVGTVIGSAAAVWASSRADPARLALVGVAGIALPLWTLVAMPPAVAIAAALCFSGIFIPLANAPIMATLTLRTPEAARAKALTALLTAEGVAGPVAYALAGPAMQSFGLRPLYWFTAIGATVAALVFACTSGVRAAARGTRSEGVAVGNRVG
jgi:MFS family permease